LPEWRPIPAQVTDRRMVLCAAIYALSAASYSKHAAKRDRPLEIFS